MHGNNQSVEQRAKLGKSLRAQTTRTSHGEWLPAQNRPDPVALLEEQNEKDYEAFVQQIRSGKLTATEG